MRDIASHISFQKTDTRASLDDPVYPYWSREGGGGETDTSGFDLHRERIRDAFENWERDWNMEWSELETFEKREIIGLEHT